MKCIVCNKEINKSMFNNAILCSSECFHINFWNELADIKDDPHVVRVDGVHYYIGNETQRGTRGFGGAKFHIKFFDGREVITTNLWHNGTIPESHKELLPDNAIFLK